MAESTIHEQYQAAARQREALSRPLTPTGGRAMKAIQVAKSETGVYEIPGAATTLDAQDLEIELSGDGYERESVDPLLGWGEWGEVECWRHPDGHAVYYFVGAWGEGEDHAD